MTDLTQRIAGLSPEKLELLLRQTRGREGGQGTIPRRAHPDEPARLSFSQQRLWFLHQLAPDDPRYNMHGAFRLAGRLDVAALTSAFQGVVARHEILRTRVAIRNGEPVQSVAAQPQLEVEVVRLDFGTPAWRLAECRQRAREDALRPFDLIVGPLLRVTLIGLGEEEWVISVTLHHIASDGWSLGVLMDELAALYTAALGAGAAELPPLPIQFADFAEWQRSELTGELMARQRAYWRQQLAGAPPLLELVTDRPRPAVQSWHGAEDRIQLSPAVTRGLRDLGARHQATLYMVLLAAYQILLWRHSGQEDVLVGSPVAGRSQVETERLIGPFVNTVVRRAHLAGDPAFPVLLAQVREATLAADAHADLPFEKLVEELQPERNASYSPLFQVWFVFHNTAAATVELPGLTLAPFEVHGGTAKFDLTLTLGERDGALSGALEYNRDLFDAATIRALREQLETLCASLVADPERPISCLPLAQPELPQRATRGAAIAAEADLGRLFHAVAERAPQATALLAGGERSTYAEVDRRTDQLARRLQSLGVGPGVLVGLCVPRAVDRLLALLATWKAGGAAVPLDPAYPQERLELLLEDTGVPVLITYGDLIYQLPTAAVACDLVCLDSDWPAIEQLSPGLPEATAAPGHPAYVVYTSGSTGYPKGVAVPRGALADHCATMAQVYGLTAEDRVLQFASLSFDAAFEQILTTLLAGATLVPRDGEVWSLRELEEQVRSLGLTVINLPTAFWEQWAREGSAEPCPTLRLAIAGGDVLSPDAARRWQESPLGAVRLINAYGPTEGIITAALYDVPPLSDPLPARVPIGQPPPGRTALVLDAAGRPAPPGVPGEIHLGDPLLALGYLHHQEATAAAFVPDPWSAVPGARLYRTGDLARWRTDGMLEFLGRRDFQRKVRGFRVELGEVEAALRRYRKVRDVAVTVRGESADERRLVAYLVPVREDEPPSASELREFLADTLPEHLLPSSYLVLGELPRTVTGKMDRAALPDLAADRPAEEVVAPRNSTEEVLAAIWCEVLGLTRVGIRDNFFNLGGHSLLGTQVIGRVLERFGVDLPLQSLFTAPTVAGLAERVDEALAEQSGGPGLPEIVPVPRDRDLPLSFAQQRLWLFEQLEPGTAAYNVAAVLDLSGRLDATALERSFAEIVQRHEVLRTTFATAAGSPVQVIGEGAAIPLQVHDLTGLPPEAQPAAVERFAVEEMGRPFDLATGPLLRTLLLRLREDEHVLLVTLHHIASDGWSVGILMREVAALYRASVAGEPSPLPPLPVQYADFAAWQRQWQDSEPLRRQVAYWRGRLHDLPPLALPTDRLRAVAPGYRGARLGFRFDAGLSQSLRELSQREGATLFMTLLAAFKILLYRYSGQPDVVVGTAVANRRRREVEALVGFFVNLLVLRTDLGGNPSFREGLCRVKETTLGALAHQDLSFDRLVEELRPERLRSRNALFQVLFLLQTPAIEALALPDFEVRPRQLDSGTSHFDLVLEVVEGERELRGDLQYDTDLFATATAERLLACFEHLLRGIVEAPETRILDLALGGGRDAVAEAGLHSPYQGDQFIFGEGR